MPIIIRKAESKDSENLARLFLETRRKTFYWQDQSQWELEDFYKKTEGEVIFLAENETKTLLGFISIWEQDSYLHNLFIAPSHQRKGIGTLLIQSLFSWLPLPYTLKCVT